MQSAAPDRVTQQDSSVNNVFKLRSLRPQQSPNLKSTNQNPQIIMQFDDFIEKYNISTNDKLDVSKESRTTRIQDALDLFVCNLISKDPKNENEQNALKKVEQQDRISQTASFIPMPEPKKTVKCMICNEHFDSYLRHIESKCHKNKSTHSPFADQIKRLIAKDKTNYQRIRLLKLSESEKILLGALPRKKRRYNYIQQSTETTTDSLTTSKIVSTQALEENPSQQEVTDNEFLFSSGE